MENYTSLGLEGNLEVNHILLVKRKEEELENYTSLALKLDMGGQTQVMSRLKG